MARKYIVYSILALLVLLGAAYVAFRLRSTPASDVAVLLSTDGASGAHDGSGLNAVPPAASRDEPPRIAQVTPPAPAQTEPAVPAIPGQATFNPAEISSYLPNPGIGWQEARTLSAPLLPETVAYRRSQYGWRDQNPEEDVFDWTAVDADLQAAVAEGRQFSFRVYSIASPGGGGHRVPQWVLDKGAAILPGGEPDYSNCVYQAEWANFVEAMRQRYDGHPDVAFIDIAGYGNYNEWSWQDQTNTKENSLDAQARRRLADLFIGGAGTIQCREPDGQVTSVAYDYPGFQDTQLLMPFAGIQQSSRYVADRRPDVGIRHDCLGSAHHTDILVESISDVIANTWRNAPIVFEFCSGSTSDPGFVGNADAILKLAHGSIVHDNLEGERAPVILTELIKYAGYRFFLREAAYPITTEAGATFDLSMTWVNTGYAPAYPKMGQDFELHFYLMTGDGSVVHDWLINADVASWMPADTLPGVPPDNLTNQTLTLSASLPSGVYLTKVAIIDRRTNQPINLALQGRDTQGRYLVGAMIIPGSNVKSQYLPLITVNAFSPAQDGAWARFDEPSIFNREPS